MATRQYGVLYFGSEDCLYLNVYVPDKINDNQPIPVIVHIYAGAFQFSGLLGTEQDQFMDKNVIFVTFNHRHGVLGFLSTEDDVVPGNMGLKDQVLALKWIKQNIEAFGGDPNRITMAGASSGGASIHYHYLSPMSAGLFRNGISMSGTALMPWALTKNSRSKALELGKLVYCEMTYIHEVIKCLRSVPVKSLFEAQANFMVIKCFHRSNTYLLTTVKFRRLGEVPTLLRLVLLWKKVRKMHLSIVLQLKSLKVARHKI